MLHRKEKRQTGKNTSEKYENALGNTETKCVSHEKRQIIQQGVFRSTEEENYNTKRVCLTQRRQNNTTIFFLETKKKTQQCRVSFVDTKKKTQQCRASFVDTKKKTQLFKLSFVR